MPKGVYPRRPGSHDWSKAINRHQDSVVRILYLDGWTQKQIAQVFDTSAKRVCYSLRRTGTPTEGRKSMPMERNPAWKGGKKIDEDGYVLIRCPKHPNAVQGYVREHRLVMEAAIGRFLERKEVVHHKNGKKDDNRICNLELFSSNYEHLRSELTGRCPKWTEEGYQRMLDAAARKREAARTRHKKS